MKENEEIKMVNSPINISIKDKYGIFSYKTVSINSNFTVLVGRNGQGKTTLLRAIVESLKASGEIAEYFDFVERIAERKHPDIESHADVRKTIIRQFEYYSEGQALADEFGDVAGLAGGIGKKARESKAKRWFLLIDGLDSGLSVDAIDSIKRFLNGGLQNIEYADGCKVYVICSANSYELASSADCLSVKTNEHMLFTDYTEFRRFILKQAK